MENVSYDGYTNIATYEIAMTLMTCQKNVINVNRYCQGDVKAQKLRSFCKNYDIKTNAQIFGRVNWTEIATDWMNDEGICHLGLEPQEPQMSLFPSTQDDEIDGLLHQISNTLPASLDGQNNSDSTLDRSPMELSVVEIIANASLDNNELSLPEQLDRTLYTKVNRVLEKLGGKWNSKSRTHHFKSDPTSKIEDFVLTGNIYKAPSFELFPTPVELSEEMVDLAEIKPGMMVLEPNYGTGRLASAITKSVPDAIIIGYEIDSDLCLEASHDCENKDFLEVTPAPIFDRILMNPPFSNNKECLHVEHALKFLKPGGRLTGIMSLGITFRESKKYNELREFILANGKIIENEDGAFQASGTMVKTVKVIIDKPSESMELVA